MPSPLSDTLRAGRARLEAGDAAGARRAAIDVLKARPDREDHARGLILLAESERAADRWSQALGIYEEIAAEFGDIDAGEIALIAAADTAETLGRFEYARQILAHYAATYPDGRFRLAALRSARRLDDLR